MSLARPRAIQSSGTPPPVPPPVFRDASPREGIDRRDAVLQAVSFAARAFLRSSDWRESIQEVLDRLGTATEVDRVYVFRNHPHADGECRTSLLYEWAAPGVRSTLDDPELQDLSYRAHGFGRWEEVLGRGEAILENVGDLPASEQPLLRSQGVLSLASVPVFVGEAWWGSIGFDVCSEERAWSVAEREALRAAADILGAAIHRRRSDGARQDREERLQGILETMTEGVAFVDRDGRITFVNAAAERILGLEPGRLPGRLYNDPAWKITSPDGAVFPDEELPFARVMRTGGPVYGVEHAIEHPDGRRVILSIGAAPLRDGSGETVGLVASLEDVTEQRRLQEELRQSQKMEAVGRLAGGIAHDFNNMLVAIRGFATLLEMDAEPTSDGALFLREIQAAVDRSASLTRQLLAFSRKQVLQPRILDLNAVVAGMEEMLGRLIGEDIDLGTELDPGLGRVSADPGQIEQVLLNLVVNARDAMPRGGRLRISTRNAVVRESRAGSAVPAGRYVVVSVRDTGCGMDETVRARIFEPFFTTKAVGMGTGLGLSTVYGIVEQSGGCIRVESEVGRGSTFHVHLPQAEDPEGMREGARPEGVHGGTEIILLVEDEPAVRALARLVLEKRGYTVLEAEDGNAALRRAGAYDGAIHLLLTDVVMPGMGGATLARRLAAEDPGLPVLFMTGYTEDTVLRHGILGPGTFLLQKPFTPAALAAKVREVLDAAGTSRRPRPGPA